MDADAKWIWLDGASRDRTVLFQREVSLEAFSESCIRITADSRYRLWVNDTWIGDGPARAYPGHYRYDVHDLSRFLSEGQNRIDVRVMHAGDDNFQYIVSEAGLLCSLEVDGETVLLSDESWDVSDVPEFEPRAPRIAQQQFPMEIVDLSRRERMWQPPNAVRSQKEDPHNGLIPRDVQLLSRVPINFGHFVAASVVTAPEHVFTFRARRIFYPESTSANILPAMGCFLTVLEAESDGRLDLQCGGIQNIFLDGCELPLECVLDSSELVMRTEEVCISAGRHLLTLVSNVDYYPTDAFLACRSAVCLTWRSPMSESGSPWVFSGILWQAPEDTNLFDDVPDEQMRFNPYPRWRWPRDRMDEMMALAGCAGVDDIIERSPAPRPLAHDELCACDPTIEVLFGSEHADTPKMSSPEACLKVGAESTMIQPCKEGDVQVVYDLDDLSVGYFDMEIDAPEGTVVDAYFAEHIEDGHIQIPGLLRNGFRIVCQEGQNHFTAGRRFGMRFALLVFRQFNRPLRLHRIRVIETTYPDSGTDRFACSDERLTRIHQISRRTLLLCMEDTFTDCPTYEQVLWIGDAANEARYAFNTFGAYDLAKRCCRIGAESLNHLPLVASQAPSGWNILLPAWSFL
ncbi:MAG: hypothetical protein HN700_19820, partial [Verrucomicrobia bacterium]|nr:hypothetical protein [Verrucomicrobiota bacterium]